MFATVYDRYYNTHDGYCGADGDGADAYDWLHLRTKDFSQICRLSGRNRLLDICEHHQPCRDAWDASESSVSLRGCVSVCVSFRQLNLLSYLHVRHYHSLNICTCLFIATLVGQIWMLRQWQKDITICLQTPSGSTHSNAL